MKKLRKFIQQVKAQVNKTAVKNALELKPLLSQYIGSDWHDYLETEHNVPKTTVLLDNEYLKLMLIYWNGFQQTSKHGHPGRGGIMKVLSGMLLETRFDPFDTDKMIGQHYHFKNAISAINDTEAVHVVENPIQYPAVSLHLYLPSMKPIEHLNPEISYTWGINPLLLH